MKEKLKLLLRWVVVFVSCFLIIYLFVFMGGWKFFESNDPILIEIGVALVFSIFIFSLYETMSKLEKRITFLEEHINELEDRIANR